MEYIATIKDGPYVDYSRKVNFYFNQTKEILDKWIDAVFGIKSTKDRSDTDLVSIRFRSDKWDKERTEKWLKDHNVKYESLTESDTLKEDAAVTTTSLGAYQTYPKISDKPFKRPLPETDDYVEDTPFMRKMKEYIN
jgi:hypothetical protein